MVPYYAPAWGYGGPPRVLFELAKYLTRRGHDVTAFTTDALDRDRRIGDRERVIDGVRVRSFPNVSNRLAWDRKVFLPVGLVPALRRAAQEFQIAHISAVRSLLHPRVHRVLRAADVPYVVDAHGALPKPVGWKRYAGMVYDALFLQPFLGDAEALLAQTKHEEDLYRSYRPDARVERLPLPTTAGDSDRPLSKGYLRERLGISADTFLVLFLGRIEGRKGVEFLVDAFAEFRRRVAQPSCLAIVGRDSGSLAQVLRRIGELGLDDVAKFVGPVYGDERFAAYHDADVFALTPPYWEETSLAALEACAVGTPCVITRQAEIPGLDEAGAGVTIPYGDRDTLAQVLARLAGNPVLRMQMGRAAAQLVRTHFTVEHVGRRLEEIYAEILERRKRGHA